MGCTTSSAAKPSVETPFAPNLKAASSNTTTLTPSTQNQNDFADPLNTQKQETDLEIFNKEKLRIEKILKEEYEILSTLGKGSCAVVYKAVYKKTQEFRALKCARWDVTDSDKKARNLRLLSQEGRLLANLSNDYIVRVFETVTTEDDAIIIMEYCEGGRLFDVLKTSKSYVSERTISHLMEQLLDAVAYLHSKNIIHRDIKIENILIESGSLNTGKIKLIDFGISVELREKCMLDKIVGTSAYMSPELVRGSYNEKIDEWACGIIMYILLSGVMPYKGRDSQEIRDIILVKRIDFSEPKLKGKSAECIQLLSGLMEREYTDRISAATALKSKWIVENQTCEIQSVDAFKLYDIEGIDPGDERLKALFEILMVRVFSDKIQDKVQVSDIFGKLDRKNRGEISFEDLVCAVIVKGIEEKKAAFYQLKFKY